MRVRCARCAPRPASQTRITLYVQPPPNYLLYSIGWLMIVACVAGVLLVLGDPLQDTAKYSPQDILVPGPFSLAATAANCSREISDALGQQWTFCLNINKVNMGDLLVSVSHVHRVEDVGGLFEIVTVTTLGVKNMKRDILQTV